MKYSCALFTLVVEYPILCEHTVIHLADLLLIDICPTLILQMMLLLTFLYKSFGYQKCVFLLHACFGAELLDHSIWVYSGSMDPGMDICESFQMN